MIVGVNVGKDPMDGHVAQGLFKEEQFHRAGSHQAKAGQQKKQSAEPGQLSRVTKTFSKTINYICFVQNLDWALYR